MAEVLALVGSLFTKAITAASTAGSFIAANAGTIGNALTVGSTIYGGVRGYQASKQEAKGLQAKGDAELAAAQREAAQKRRETQLIVSRQQAVAAASGGGASDPTVKSIMGKTIAEGANSAKLDMYNGLVSRADLYREAATTRSEGKSKMFGSFVDAASTIYGGVAKRRREAYAGDNYVY